MELVCAGDVMLEVVVKATSVAEQGGETDAKLALRAGGQALNVARIFSQLGGKSVLAACMGQDAAGKFLAHELQKQGVGLIHPKAADSSGMVVSFVEGQHRTMYTQRGANRSLDLKKILALKKTHRCAWYFSGYLPLNPAGKTQIRHCLEVLSKFQRPIAVDTPPAPMLKKIDPGVFLDVFKGATIFFATEDEARLLTATAPIAAMAQRLQKHFPLVVIKQGPKGCWLQTAKGGQHIPTTPLAQVDPTGAGDTFCGSFLFALLDKTPPEQAAVFAHKVTAHRISLVPADVERGREG